MELDFITLEDDNNYAIIDTIEVNNNRYLFLADANEFTKITVRKVIREEGKEYLVKLDDEEEFDSVMSFYNEVKGGKNEEK